MNNHIFIVVFSFLSVCALADVYVIPELPCQWTFIWNCSNTDGYNWHVVQQVNGDFMRMERITSAGHFWEESVFRSDLDNEHIIQFTRSSKGRSEQVASDATIKLYMRPMSFKNNELIFAYDTATNDTYYGRECTHYHNNDENSDFYVGLDGLPIGKVTNNHTDITYTNYTWQKTAPLSWFVFDRSVNFNDERIYTAPIESICTSVSSSSSSEPQSKSVPVDDGDPFIVVIETDPIDE